MLTPSPNQRLGEGRKLISEVRVDRLADRYAADNCAAQEETQLTLVVKEYESKDADPLGETDERHFTVTKEVRVSAADGEDILEGAGGSRDSRLTSKLAIEEGLEGDVAPEQDLRRSDRRVLGGVGLVHDCASEGNDTQCKHDGSHKSLLFVIGFTEENLGDQIPVGRQAEVLSISLPQTGSEESKLRSRDVRIGWHRRDPQRQNLTGGLFLVLVDVADVQRKVVG